MLDCGFNAERSWFPSLEFARKRIDTLMLLNLDEDHVSDLPYLLDMANVRSLVTNPTITPEALVSMKPDGMDEGVRTAFRLLRHYRTRLIGNWRHPLGGIQWEAFWNRYGLDYKKTNELSLAVFVSFGRFTILFGGDMEAPAWNTLLRNRSFRGRLPEVNVYVASHHGRRNGLSDQLMALMEPEVVLISDGPKQYATQETTKWYSDRVVGIPDLDQIATGNTLARRRVLTTRRDGSIRINAQSNGQYLISYEGCRIPIPQSTPASLAKRFPSSQLPPRRF